MRPTRLALPMIVAAALLLAGCGSGGSAPAEVPDTAGSVVGERLFRETRFAQSAFAATAGDVNASSGAGDPALDTTETLGEPLPGAYAGLSMNCAACHLVDEHADTPGGGLRTYGDFARRSPVPEREDGRTVTPRNSPPLVNAALERAGATFFHFDGEFATLEDLVAATLTGRNYGWLPGERALAVAHVARVVREDDGSDANADDHGGGSYADVFAARANVLPRDILLPPDFRLDVAAATDEEVLAAVARVIAQYVRELLFAQDPEAGTFNGSPYDRFLALNGLPAAPDPGEPALDYARRLRTALEGLGSPRFVDASDAGRFEHHAQSFAFGAAELRGLLVFLSEPSAHPPSAAEVAAGGRGSCIRCHAPPAFTDFRFHNVGVAQEEFDDVHGDGSFAALTVPTLAQRLADPEAFLPATAAHPGGLGPFLDVPAPGRPGVTDLGLWNVFANPDVPTPQADLRATVLFETGLPPGTTDDDLLPLTIAWFKTPGLRDLADAAPYFHTGRKDGLRDVLAHYGRFGNLARAGSVRNAAPELSDVTLVPADFDALLAFLEALNEDYD
jgi:cytochrome c peroxidase